MKTLLLIPAIFLFSIVTYGQKRVMPSFYLDGEKIDIEKVHINPQMIDSIIVQKEIGDGIVLITSKSKSMKFFTLNYIIKHYTKISNQERELLFKINTTFITDTTGILIDQSFFIYVNSFNIEKTEYLSNKFDNLTIIEIALEEKERAQQVLIRGEELFKMKEN